MSNTSNNVIPFPYQADWNAMSDEELEAHCREQALARREEFLAQKAIMDACNLSNVLIAGADEVFTAMVGEEVDFSDIATFNREMPISMDGIRMWVQHSNQHDGRAYACVEGDTYGDVLRAIDKALSANLVGDELNHGRCCFIEGFTTCELGIEVLLGS
jgi:hypothetical protein